MDASSQMRILSEAETEVVSGGEIIEIPYDEYWQEELLRYKTGLSSIFGNQP